MVSSIEQPWKGIKPGHVIELIRISQVGEVGELGKIQKERSTGKMHHINHTLTYWPWHLVLDKLMDEITRILDATTNGIRLRHKEIRQKSPYRRM